MALFTIGDLHLALGCDKPMDIFDGWENYLSRLESNWLKLVSAEDTVVLAGDTSWAMKLEHCLEDFAFLQKLPGKKILLKGNHDYWWSTMAKMEHFRDENGFDSIFFLFNNAYIYGNYALCGTRGWLSDTSLDTDAKIMQRELGRLQSSLDAAHLINPSLEKLVFLHYPPVSSNSLMGEFVNVMQDNGIKHCYYGHLHGNAIRWAVQGLQDGIQYKLISADAVGFTPVFIAE